MLCADRVGKFIEGAPVLAVHSVYRRTVNVRMGDDIGALHPAELPLTPLSASLPLTDGEFAIMSRAAAQSGRVAWEKGVLRAGEKSWRVGEIRTWNPLIRRYLDGNQQRCLREAVETFLMEQEERPDSFGRAVPHALAALDRGTGEEEKREDTGLLKQELSYRLEKILLCGSGRNGELADRAMDMIGLGIGLTPSGDDFLVGMLLAFWTCRGYRGCFDQLANGIKKKSGDTNQISGQYLLRACQGEYGLLFHKLIDQLQAGVEIRGALEQIGRIGHSSGIDTLNGLLTGLWLCREE